MEPIEILKGRSVAENHLYLDIAGCEPGRRGHRLETHQGELVSVYTCRCNGSERTFYFQVNDDPLAEEPGPSRILGPGQFLLHAERLARGIPASPDGLDASQLAEGHRRIQTAATCLRDVLAFIPPDEDCVPASAFRSIAGKEAYLAEAGRFRRFRIEAVARAYERIAGTYRASLEAEQEVR